MSSDWIKDVALLWWSNTVVFFEQVWALIQIPIWFVRYGLWKVHVLKHEPAPLISPDE